MIEVITICRDKRLPMNINHPCFEGINLDQMPEGRMGEAVVRLKETGSKHLIKTKDITIEYLRKNKGVLFKETISECYYTVLGEEGYLVMYKINQIRAKDYWTIKQHKGIDCVTFGNNKNDKHLGIDYETGYCEEIIKG